jgi:SAM-dependent methyltransferase
MTAAPVKRSEMTADTVDYDLGWETRWDDMRRYGPTARHMRNIVTTLVSGLDYATVLDVGCGQGTLLSALMPLKPQAGYFGADFSPKGLEMARRRMPAVEFFQLDLEKGALDRRFDLVVCTDVVEHIADDDSAFRNLAAMTGGHLLVSTMQGRMRDFEKSVGHYRNYKYGEVQAKLEAAGLETVRVVQWGFPFFSPLHRDLLAATGAHGTEGTFGPGRRLIAEFLYQLFRLNSWDHGDYVAVLARRRG